MSEPADKLRQCSKCGGWFDVDAGFYRYSQGPPRRQCKECQRKHARDRNRRINNIPPERHYRK